MAAADSTLEVFKLKRNGKESAKFYGWVRLGPGRRRRVALDENKGTARLKLAEEQEKADNAALGIRDRFKENRGRPLADQVAEFKLFKASQNSTPGHVKTTVQRITDIIDGCDFRLLADIDLDAVSNYLAGRRKAGLSVTSSNNYVTAIKGLTKWLTDGERLPKNPLRKLEKIKADADLKHQRRALSDDDFARLLEAARKSRTVVCGLTGKDRAAIYRLAAYTGLRASALASLTVEAFDLKAKVVTVHPGYQKNRKAKTLPIHADLMETVEACIKGKAPADRLWPGLWAKNRHGAEMVQTDLAAASEAIRKARKLPKSAPDPLPYEDDAGRVFDFHALRGQFGTMLARAGVHPRRAQELMGHSDINLTMKFYTRLELSDLHAAVGSLPAPPAVASKKGRRRRAPKRAPANTISDHSGPSDGAADNRGKEAGTGRRKRA